MSAKSNIQLKAEIRRLDDEDPVEAPRGNHKHFKLIGIGFSQDMVVYISKNSDGSDKVDVEVVRDDSATSTDKVWPAVAKPALGVDPTDSKKPLWVAIKRNDQFENAYQGFIVI
ncbi:hypothetical protein OLZ32_22380 [Rhizobium sp. 1AS11]|uniref:hypothetical protein n=1 Tax=Rhizobium acaciae TaxID=2989736 RepID=UPI002221BC50|nr:hypothetical protein [Rhizobium acaciae]MCW1411020.1 hypothetical protein [Rhizobium acaciae]MCW1743128.1 hypothetical protein [Rhizobium acaciae]